MGGGGGGGGGDPAFIFRRGCNGGKRGKKKEGGTRVSLLLDTHKREWLQGKKEGHASRGMKKKKRVSWGGGEGEKPSVNFPSQAAIGKKRGGKTPGRKKGERRRERRIP